MNDEQIKREASDRRLEPDLGRVEPILEFAPVEQHLQRADRDAECRKAEKIEALMVGMTAFVNEKQDSEEGNDADRQIDVEHPAPVVIVGQPATQRGAGDGPD